MNASAPVRPHPTYSAQRRALDFIQLGCSEPSHGPSNLTAITCGLAAHSASGLDCFLERGDSAYLAGIVTL